MEIQFLLNASISTHSLYHMHGYFQKSIEIQDFCNGQPDILAHSAAAIMERVNQGGSKTERALKALCRRELGLEVEVCSIFSQFQEVVSSN